MSTNGLIIGKFLPFHKGHEFLITESLELCDKLFIIVSKNNNFNQKLQHEIQFLSDHEFREDAIEYTLDLLLGLEEKSKRIIIETVDETNIPNYPNGWLEFADLCNSKMKIHNFTPNKIFTSEESDINGYNTYFPHCDVQLIDIKRKNIAISATELRNDIYQLSQSLNKLKKFLPHFTIGEITQKLIN